MSKLLNILKGSKKNLASIAAAGAIASPILTGCSTIVSPSLYPVPINSEPSGAKVIVKRDTGEQVFAGRTPTTVFLKPGGPYFQKYNYLVDISKDGYEPQTSVISSEFNPIYLGNFFFGGVIGLLIVDPLSGAVYKIPTGASCNVFLSKEEKEKARKEE
jgi:hypothetical protein